MAESLIDSGEGRLVALSIPTSKALTSQGMSEEAINGLMEENIKTLNSNLPAYSQVQRFNLTNEEFEKTPKRSDQTLSLSAEIIQTANKTGPACIVPKTEVIQARNLYTESDHYERWQDV